MMKKVDNRKFELVKSMDTIVKKLYNAEAYYGKWVYIVGEDANDEDFCFVAKDEELFTATVKCFNEIMREYLEEGIYVGKDVYKS